MTFCCSPAASVPAADPSYLQPPSVWLNELPKTHDESGPDGSGFGFDVGTKQAGDETTWLQLNPAAFD